MEQRVLLNQSFDDLMSLGMLEPVSADEYNHDTCYDLSFEDSTVRLWRAAGAVSTFFTPIRNGRSLKTIVCALNESMSEDYTIILHTFDNKCFTYIEVSH